MNRNLGESFGASLAARSISVPLTQAPSHLKNGPEIASRSPLFRVQSHPQLLTAPPRSLRLRHKRCLSEYGARYWPDSVAFLKSLWAASSMDADTKS